MSFGRGSSLTDLPLCHSLSYQPGYDTFRTQLKKSLSLFHTSKSPTTGDETIDAALEVLQTEGEKEEDHDETDDNVEGSASDRDDIEGSASSQDEMEDEMEGSASDRDENMVDETDQPHAPVDNVDDELKILVRNATEEFGFAPRDVYRGVFDLPKTMSQHTETVGTFDYSKLKALLRSFSNNRALAGFSHGVVAVYPCKGLKNLDGWTMDFKSIRIREKVMERVQLGEYNHIRETFDFLYKIPAGSTFAGWYFETIAGRMLSSGWQSDGPPPQPIPMVSDCLVPPTFSTDPDSPPSQLPFPPLRNYDRVHMPVDFKNKLSNLILNGNEYYTPIATNNPLFDSFTIDREENTVTISIFQITISQKHGGSSKGYGRIQEIIARVRKLVKEANLKATVKNASSTTKVKKSGSKTEVKVKYFLVCPESELEHQWEMPDGWKKTKNYHGEVFCVRIPTSVHHGVSCLFTLNSATWLNCNWM